MLLETDLTMRVTKNPTGSDVKESGSSSETEGTSKASAGKKKAKKTSLFSVDTLSNFGRDVSAMTAAAASGIATTLTELAPLNLKGSESPSAQRRLEQVRMAIGPLVQTALNERDAGNLKQATISLDGAYTSAVRSGVNIDALVAQLPKRQAEALGNFAHTQQPLPVEIVNALRSKDPAALGRLINEDLNTSQTFQRKGHFGEAMRHLRRAHRTAQDGKIDLANILKNRVLGIAKSSLLMGDLETFDYIAKNGLEAIQPDDPGLVILSIEKRIIKMQPTVSRHLSSFIGEGANFANLYTLRPSQALVVDALVKTQDPKYMMDILGSMEAACAVALGRGDVALAERILTFDETLQRGDVAEQTDIGKPPPYSADF
jgi:hypothetical protein